MFGGLGVFFCFFFFQAEDGIRDFCLSRGLGDVYKRQGQARPRVAGPAVMLAAEPSAHFRRHGWVHLPGFFGPSETASLLAWTDEITGWPETPGAWMRYYEKAPDGGRMLARIENFVPYHEELAT